MANPYYFRTPYQPVYQPKPGEGSAVFGAQPGQPDFNNVPQAPYPTGTPKPPGPGANVAGIAGAVGGAAALAGSAVGMANEKLNINGEIAPSQYDQSMAPVYTGGQLAIDASQARAKGATGGEILSGVGSGAAIGTSILPGWGTAIGAVVGAGTSLIGGGIRKKKQRREKNIATAQANRAAEQFNTADVSFRQRSAAMEDYQQRTNSNNRLYNLYRNQY